VFKSSEEREAARREREAAEAQAEAERAEQARLAAEERQRAQWLASPLGAATAAMEAGQTFFEIQLQVGAHTGSAGFGTTDSQRTVAFGRRARRDRKARLAAGARGLSLHGHR
jgi:hypothetical protein